MSRLIDAEELKAKLRQLDWQDLYLPVHFDNMIDECKTIEERKKGKWLRDPPEGGYALWKCSVCGKCWLHWWASAMTVEEMTKEVRCCPHCGAEMVSNMRGDGNETN